MSEELIAEIKEVFNSINEDKKLLDGTIDTVEEKGKTLISFFSKQDKYPEFEAPQDFRSALADLSGHVGHALFIVLDIENKRAGLIKVVEETKTNPAQGPSVVVSSPPAVTQAPSGFWGGYMGVKAQSKTVEKIEKMKIEAKEERPKITTEERVRDVLDFGRDLIPEFVNRTYTFFQQSLDMLYFYSDDATKRFLHGELSLHLNKLNAIIQSFCRTVVEYRKSVLDEIKMELVKGMTEVVTAQIFASSRGAPTYLDPMALEFAKRRKK